MKKSILLGFILVASAVSFAAQSKSETNTPIKPDTVAQTFPEGFKTDNCSLFFDFDYADCCIAHDVEYFKGGSWKQRWQADSRLRKCVAAKNGWWHKPLSLMIWSGVRIGGAPFLPTKFRWGFGKRKPEIKRQKLQVEEKHSVDLPKTKP